MDEQMEMQTQRVSVRRINRKPTWERTLRKYFPTIRFILICILLLLMVALVIKAVVVGIMALFSKDESAAVPYSYCEMVSQDPYEEVFYDFPDAI